MKLSSKGLQLILDGEVGGGEKYYYDGSCARPTVPGGPDTVSGITIGVGYDLGQTSHKQFFDDWEDLLSTDVMAKLTAVVGLRGNEARRDLPMVRDIVIPWETALEQFEQSSIPRYWTLTEKAFPGVAHAPECVQEVLLSIVFNRGTSMAGSRRVEMAKIKRLIEAGQWSKIPAEIRSMKRLWPASKGLRDRREAEARYIEEGLKSTN